MQKSIITPEKGLLLELHPYETQGHNKQAIH